MKIYKYECEKCGCIFSTNKENDKCIRCSSKKCHEYEPKIEKTPMMERIDKILADYDAKLKKQQDIDDWYTLDEIEDIEEEGW